MVWVAAGFVVVALFASLMNGTVSDVACVACHQTQANGLHGAAAHGDLRCYQCHVGSSLDSLLAAKSDELRMVVSKVGSGSTSFSDARVSRSACLRCHQVVLGEVVSAGGIRIQHETCAVPPQACSDCHSGVFHGHDPYPGRGIAMDRCLLCHDGVDITAACDTCHEGSGHADRPSTGSWSVTHGPQWENTHGMGELSTCSACHAPNMCEGCHGVPLPHPGGYVNGDHGAEAEQDPTRCVECHSQVFCDDCHGLSMPHDTEFMLKHSTVVKDEGEAVCATCHVLDECSLCHVKHTHPGRLSRDD